jgi:eukaryotic-like serine/threonine-protein kinase
MEQASCPHCGQKAATSVGGLCAGCLAGTAFLDLEPDAEPNGGLSPERLGDYELYEELGRGGMGVVYRARQLSLDRDVALKVIPGGPLADPEALRRFRLEARAAARLRHPHVVPVYEVGETGSHAYFSMELIAGPTLGERIRRSGALGPKTACACLGKLASAIQRAHELGLLHRDLKPSNILFDADDEPRLADFGLVKSMGAQVDGELTLTRQSVGTPAWFAPEQAAGGEATPLTDVYGLGALLYFALTGRTPFPGRDMADLLSRVQSEPPLAPRTLDPSIPRDLETICLKALEKAPEQRYTSAPAFAEDLERWLTGEPIKARPVGRAIRLWRWMARRPGLSLALTGLLLALVGGAGGMSVLWLRASRAAQAETLQRQRAEEELWRSLVAVAQRERASRLNGGPHRALEALRRAAAIRPGLELREEAIAALVSPDFEPPQQFTWHNLTARAMRYPPEFSPDGTLASVVMKSGSAALVDARTGTLLRALHGSPWEPGEPAHFSPLGRWLWRVDDKRRLRIWSVLDGSEQTLESPEDVRTVSWSTADQFLLLARAESAELLTQSDWRLRRRIPLPAFWEAQQVSHDGSLLALSRDKKIEVRPLDGGPLRLALSTRAHVHGLAWSLDDTLLSAASDDNLVTVWDVASGQKWRECNGHDSRPAWQVFLPNGSLVTGSWDRSIRLWNPYTGKNLLTMPLSLDSPTWSSSGLGVEYKSWTAPIFHKLRPSPTPRVLHHPSAPNSIPAWSDVAFSPDGRVLYTCGTGLAAWDGSTGQHLATLEPKVKFVSVLPDGSGSVVVSSHAGSLQRSAFDPVSSTFSPLQTLLKNPKPVNNATMVGEKLAFSCPSEKAYQWDRVELWNGSGRVQVWNTGNVWPTLDLSPDGAWLAVGGSGLPLLLSTANDASSSIAQAALDTRGSEKLHSAFSPDSRIVAFQSFRAVRLWDVASRRLLHTISRPDNSQGNLLAFSPDGTLLAALGPHWEIWLIDPITGQRLATLTSPEPHMTSALAFSPDSQRLAVAQANDVTLLWDLPKLRGLLAAEGLDW